VGFERGVRSARGGGWDSYRGIRVKQYWKAGKGFRTGWEGCRVGGTRSQWWWGDRLIKVSTTTNEGKEREKAHSTATSGVRSTRLLGPSEGLHSARGFVYRFRN